MLRIRRQLLLLVICASCLPPLAGAQPRDEVDENIEAKIREELQVRPPPAPKPENLLPFEASAANSNKMFLDASSITISPDRTVRYTLVVRSPSGVDNVSYEGIRCETREQKYYAYGRRDGSWAVPRVSEWRPIESKGSSLQHRELYRDYFCPVGGAVRSAKDIINRLKYGVPTNEMPPGSNRR